MDLYFGKHGGSGDINVLQLSEICMNMIMRMGGSQSE